MLIEASVKVGRWMERYRVLVAVVMWTAFGLVSADYAGFIDLPTFILLPVAATGLLTGLRYMLWEGFLRPRVIKRMHESTASEAGESASPLAPQTKDRLR
jgi:hypothetical protein